MRTDRPNPNWPASTYNGFAGPATAVEAPAAAAPRRQISTPVMLAGIAAAVAGGVALGFAAQPRDVSAAQAEAAATPLPVELAPPPSAPAVAARPAGRLDVRPTQDAPAPPQPLALPGPAVEPPTQMTELRRERVEPPPPLVREAPPLELETQQPALEDEPPLEEFEEPTG